MKENYFEYSNIEVKREESPERFLDLFSEISKMKVDGSHWDEEDEEYAEMLSRTTGSVGAIVVGSSAEKLSTPKDLDVVLVTKAGANMNTRDYIEEICEKFDQTFSFSTKEINSDTPLMFQIERGRLDVLGAISYHQDPDPLLQGALKKTPEPIVFSFSEKHAKGIHELIQKIKEIE